MVRMGCVGSEIILLWVRVCPAAMGNYSRVTICTTAVSVQCIIESCACAISISLAPFQKEVSYLEVS